MLHPEADSNHIFSWPINLSLDIGNIFAVIIASIALYFAYCAFKNEKEKDRETLRRNREEDLQNSTLEKQASAKHLYMEYLKYSINNPKLAAVKYIENDEESLGQYDYYVSMVLWIFDEYLELENYEFCLPALKYEISKHHSYIRSTIYNPYINGKESKDNILYSSGYSDKMMEIMGDVLKSKE